VLNTELTLYLNCDRQVNLNLVNFFDEKRSKKYILSVGTIAACPIEI
jgi:hypothetical protein